MAMTIMNDAAAALTLGELNKNISSLGKQLKKVSSGMRVNSAGDDASGYSISEKMRVRIRALAQDERNVQNGAALLRTAEGGIQQQIEIMKAIKEKVINADNDTNTDIDRATIQKEIDQSYRQIQDIAYETNYNGKRLLVGDTKIDEIYVWQVKSQPVTTPDSSLNIITDATYDTLDGETGPFAAFSTYQETAATASPLLGSSSSVMLEGGTDPTNVYSKFTMDFSNYTDVSQLNGVGFQTNGYYYVLTNNPSGNIYKTTGNTIASEIDISGLDTVEKVANKVAQSGIYGTSGTGTVSGSTITFTRDSTSNSTTPMVTGWGAEASSVPVGSASATGLFPSPATATGTDAVYHYERDPATDLNVRVEDSPATPAKMTKDISSVADGTGITVKDYGGRAAYIKFIDGTSGLTQQADGSYTVGKNATVSNRSLYTKSSATDSGTYVYVNFALSGGQMTLTSAYSGASYSVTASDGIDRSGTWEYSAVTAYSGTASNATGGVAGTYNNASYSIDLTAYNTRDADALATFTDELLGKAMALRYGSGTPHAKYEFVDTTEPDAMEAIVQTQRYQGVNSTPVDLKELRTMLEGNSTITIADAFISLMRSKSSYYFTDASDTGAGTKVLKVNASNSQAWGNNEKIEITEGKLSQYTIDFADYFQNNSVSIPEGLDGKGFRAYCATCPDQWFNFQFSMGGDLDATRPASGSSGADLKTTVIDVSGVTDVKSLVTAIYDTAQPAMESIMNGDPHTLHIAANPDKGTVTIYDGRPFKLAQSQFPDLTDKGAKIADGVLDDVLKVTRGVYVKNLVIQDTDKANQNIRLRIPQTTLDHLFNYIEDDRSISEFNVLTSASREMMLGNMKGEKRSGGVANQDERGALDMALDYLTGANTLIGAQIMRLEMTEANIVTSRENTTASESTIRDADMAKEMTGYTKANVLAQAAQSMLAQANQNSSAVLSLLQ